MTDPDPGMAGRSIWRNAVIEAIRLVTPEVRSFLLRVDGLGPFRAGHYVDVRLTAPDGYQAQRSYSIASSPTDPSRIEIMIERLGTGEVSGFFHEVAQVGDSIELRGPIGGPFTWAPADGGPLLLAGGGSGVVPLLSMLRLRAEATPEIPALLLYSVRGMEHAIALDELMARAETEPGFRLMLHATRDHDAATGRVRGHIDREVVDEALRALRTMQDAVPRGFVVGSNAFVGTVTGLMVDAGLPPGRIRTERFGG